jgi:hypothetical protein
MIGSLGTLVERQGSGIGNDSQGDLQDTLIGNPTRRAISHDYDAGLIRHSCTLPSGSRLHPGEQFSGDVGCVDIDCC